MPKVHIVQAHSLGREELKKRIQKLADQEATRHGVHAHWTSAYEMGLKARGVKGSVLIEDDSVVVDLDLGLLLWPMKGRIESGITEGLRQALA
jgi:putative polyhydroxyalkanoate system protein